jgi:hypothetical protein
VQTPDDPAVKARAFAAGLRKNALTAGRRWTSWPGGAAHLATVVAAIDAIRARLDAPDADIAAGIGDLRAILEWTTYQSASLSTARALVFARKTRTFAEEFGLLDAGARSLSVLVDSESSLIENVRTKNGYMSALAARAPHLALPPPLVSAESLAPKPAKKPGRLALIQQLTKSAKRKS